MSAEQSEILCSTLTLLGPRTLNLLIQPVEASIKMALDCGYDGVELRTPRESFYPGIGSFHVNVRGFPAERRLAQGLLSDEASLAIRRAEQSYRGEATLRQSFRHRERALALVSFGLLPHRTESLLHLKRLQKLVGPISVTVYPARNKIEENLHRGIANKLIQPGLDLVKQAGIQSFDELVDFYQTHPEYNINFDPAHYLLSGLDLPPVDKALEAMSPFIAEFQFPGARTDLSMRNLETDQTFQDLLTGSDKSQAARMLLMLKEMGFRGPVVPEFSPFKGTGLNTVETHKRAVGSLRKLLTS